MSYLLWIIFKETLMRLFFPDNTKENKPKKIRISQTEEVLTILEWAKIIVYTHIPGMDLIMMLYWIFSKKATITQKNFSKALLLVRIGGFIALEICSFILLKIVGYY